MFFCRLWWKLSSFQDPPTPCLSKSKIASPPLTLDVQFQINPISSKLWNNNRTVHVNERIQNKNKTKSCHIQIDHAFYCSI